MLSDKEQYLVMFSILTFGLVMVLWVLNRIVKELSEYLKARDTDHLLGGHPLDH